MAKQCLRNAQIAKDDEFYTAYDDIQKELIHYARLFRGKVIYCNCDDHNGIGLGTPQSNFLKYLADNFQAFGIKKVIATHYEPNKRSTMYILDKDNTGDGIICAEDILEIPLMGDGDFRSDECIGLLKQADIVITNPPFSLFREYVAQLMEYKKKFLIIGNDNCRTYKEIFPLIKNNQFWCGYNHVKEFSKPDGTTKKFGNVSWYTNLPTTRRNEYIDTGKKYYGFEGMYPRYDNSDAISVDKISDIPMDYDGVMGVPITFIDRYNPEQFEIIRFRKGDDNKDLAVNGKCPYFRILIRKKKEN
ncbi:MAG: hypothetical protein IJY77_02000 [Alphaproteobacteria bacterium]|nr:hypothetical protein [Alphaproteobacteria bacterium]